MSSPDLAAAQYTEDEPTWKGSPLPLVGAQIKVQALGNIDGRIKTQHRYLTVAFEPTVDEHGDLVIPYRDKPYDAAGANPVHTITLAGDCLADHWYTLGSPPVAVLPEPDFDPVTETKTDDIPPADATTVTGMLKRWLYLKDKITEADALSKALKAEKAALNDQIVDECVQNEFTKPPGVGDFTFSFKPTYYTQYAEKDDGTKADTADVIEALRATGLDVGIVAEGYNGGTLKAMLRERQEAGMSLPDELAAVISLESKSEVSATRSAARNRRGRPAAIDND
jgi:hypothetical protein